MMTRMMAAVTTMIFALGVEPAVPGDTDLNLARYAITQGGLLAVVLVLCWYIRELHKDKTADLLAQRERESERIDALMTLVGQTNLTMQKNISVGEAQEKAIDRLARALEGRG